MDRSGQRAHGGTDFLARNDNGPAPGTPSGDTDATVVYAYTDGLRISITADLPAGQTDQVTTYTYGTAGGGAAGDSEIATGHLLQEVEYPDSASASDVVSFAYNAQGQQVWKEDQAGNVIETVYDTGGRATERKVTTLASGFDGDVRRIQTAYDDLGRRESVTQYDAASSGNATDGVAFTYGGWGNLTEYEEDRNGAVSSGGDEYDIVYTWETATGGRNTLRRNETTLPSGAVMDYDYRDAGGRHDSDMSRVTSIDLGIRLVVSYAYNGVGQVVQMDYPEPDARSRRYGSTSGDYEDWDRFNRITSDDWTAYSGTATNFYDIDIAYDENSNITLIEDNVHSGFDVDYTMDELDRLTRAEEGTWGGSSITTTSRDQEWLLDQVGNWDEDKLDLDGDGFYTGTDEHHDARTHNKVNELTARDTNNDSTDDFTLVYDAAGNLTDDGESYKYEYDAFYRLRYVKDQSNNVVAEHRYNGLGHRIGEHVDTDDDGDVDGSDEWRYFAYDERWRIVAHFLGSDTAPTEEFVHHAAGLDGGGRSSYIDLVALRERDTDDNGSREERMYFCQNWRADVSAIIDSNGEMYEWVKYSAYGVPFGLPGADTDSDGDCDSTDINALRGLIAASDYDVRADLDLDGVVDSSDRTIAEARPEGLVLGRWEISALKNDRGLAGYRVLASMRCSVVRMRFLSLGRGRWLQRDPMDFGSGLEYSYVGGSPIRYVDPFGLFGVATQAGSVGSKDPAVPGQYPGGAGAAQGAMEEDCCRKACERLNSDPDLQVYGTVACCGEPKTKTLCICDDEAATSPGHTRATVLHEMTHVADATTSCSGGYATVKGWFYGDGHPTADDSTHGSEWAAHMVEYWHYLRRYAACMKRAGDDPMRQGPCHGLRRAANRAKGEADDHEFGYKLDQMGELLTTGALFSAGPLIDAYGGPGDGYYGQLAAEANAIAMTVEMWGGVVQ